MNISEISQWVQCEAMGLASQPQRGGRYRASAYVGHLAHHRLVEGLPLSEIDTATKVVAWDAVTRNNTEALVQAEAIAQAGEAKLAQFGWEITDRERAVDGTEHRGRADLIAWHTRARVSSLIDVKTGRGLYAGWLQVGGYLDEIEREGKELDGIDFGAILHIPRVPPNRDPVANLELRHAEPLARAWRAWVARVEAIGRGADAMRSPGDHCRACRARNCPVRSGLEPTQERK